MPDVDTSFAFTPPYMRLSQPTAEPSTRSFEQAYEMARREQSPLYKAEVAQREQQTQQQAALFPFKQQMAQFALEETVDKMDIMQSAKANRLKTTQAMADVSRMWAGAHDLTAFDMKPIWDRIAQDWAPELKAAGDSMQNRVDQAVRTKMTTDARVKAAQIAATSREDVAKIRIDPTRTTPYVQEFEGKHFLVNPRTGNVHPLTMDPGDKATLEIMRSHVQALNRSIAKAKELDASADTSVLDKQVTDLMEQIKNFGKTPKTPPGGADESGTTPSVVPQLKTFQWDPTTHTLLPSDDTSLPSFGSPLTR